VAEPRVVTNHAKGRSNPQGLIPESHDSSGAYNQASADVPACPLAKKTNSGNRSVILLILCLYFETNHSTGSRPQRTPAEIGLITARFPQIDITLY
jgi:hypothetical protein